MRNLCDILFLFLAQLPLYFSIAFVLPFITLASQFELIFFVGCFIIQIIVDHFKVVFDIHYNCPTFCPYYFSS